MALQEIVHAADLYGAFAQCPIRQPDRQNLCPHQRPDIFISICMRLDSDYSDIILFDYFVAGLDMRSHNTPKAGRNCFHEQFQHIAGNLHIRFTEKPLIRLRQKFILAVGYLRGI